MTRLLRQAVCVVLQPRTPAALRCVSCRCHMHHIRCHMHTNQVHHDLNCMYCCQTWCSNTHMQAADAPQLCCVPALLPVSCCLAIAPASLSLPLVWLTSALPCLDHRHHHPHHPLCIHPCGHRLEGAGTAPPSSHSDLGALISDDTCAGGQQWNTCRCKAQQRASDHQGAAWGGALQHHLRAWVAYTRVQRDSEASCSS